MTNILWVGLVIALLVFLSMIVTGCASSLPERAYCIEQRVGIQQGPDRTGMFTQHLCLGPHAETPQR